MKISIPQLLEKSSISGCSKIPGCKACEDFRNEAYLSVRRSDGRRAQRSRWVFFNGLITAVAVLILCLALIDVGASEAGAPAGGFQLVRLKYRGGGDWYSDPTSLPNLLREVEKVLGVETPKEEVRLPIMDEALFSYPFLYMTGHGKVKFSDEEAARLRRYLVSGGFLWADDNYGMDEHFRRELRKVFPEAELVEIPFDHEVYHVIYDFPAGLPKIHEHHGGPPHGYGILHDGRLVVFYSYNTDIGDGLEDAEVHRDPPEKREAAERMALNIVAYALTH